MALEFITTRGLENKNGGMKGKIRILKVKEEAEANVELTCPECGNDEKRREVWTEPFVTGTGINRKFNLQCGKCGFKIKMLRLKKAAKEK